jgi:hypothetical protein
MVEHDWVKNIQVANINSEKKVKYADRLLAFENVNVF